MLLIRPSFPLHILINELNRKLIYRYTLYNYVTALLDLSLVSQSSATTPITAIVTLHTSTVTWNEAHSFCQSVNQSLLTADTQERRDALLYSFHKEPWQSVK